MKKIVVLISGVGSNLQAIIDECHAKRINGRVVAVMSNKPEIYGLLRAKQANIPTHVINHHDFLTREAFDETMQREIDSYRPDLIVLAGYMRILTPNFVKHYLGKMLNTHPSLLPKYPGLHTHRRAIEAGDKKHGATVHFVTEELDGGPVILQAEVPIFSDDKEQDLASRVHIQERRIYPRVIKWFCDDRLKMQNDKTYLDGQMLSLSGFHDD